MTKDKLVSLSKHERDIAAKKQALLDKQEAVIAEVHKQVEALKREVTRIGMAQMAEVKAKIQEKREKLQAVEEKMGKEAENLTTLFDSARYIAEEADDIEVVMNGPAVCKELKEALESEIDVDLEELRAVPTFVPGNIDMEKMTALVGKLAIDTAVLNDDTTDDTV